MKIWTVFKFENNQSMFCYLVSDPTIAKHEIDSKYQMYQNPTWELSEYGFWMRTVEGEITHSIVPQYVDHKEVWIDEENAYRWMLIGDN